MEQAKLLPINQTRRKNKKHRVCHGEGFSAFNKLGLLGLSSIKIA
jgi:hypothetical protein